MSHTLIAVCGQSPQVITETAWALVQGGAPLASVQVLTTTVGKDLLEEKILGAQEPVWEQLFQACAQQTAASLHIHVLRDAQGRELEDIRTPADNLAARDQIFALVQELAGQETGVLHASLSGGRKTMGFLLGAAMQFLGRPQDRLYHVLVQPREVERPDTDFYFPSARKDAVQVRAGGGSIGPLMITADGVRRPLRHDEVRVELAQLPMCRVGRIVEFATPGSFAEDSLLLAQAAVDRHARMLRREYLHEARGNPEDAFPEILGRGAAIRGVKRAIAQAAPTHATVLISGETGVGKELVARAVHKASGRSGSLVTLDCGRYTENLLEDRIFVDFTAGTKVLAAAAVHAALTVGLSADIRLIYIGGERRGADGRVLADAMLPRVVTLAQQQLQEAVRLLGALRYRDASAVMAQLADSGPSGYVRTSLDGLLAWEDFDYETAVNRFTSQASAAEVLMDDALLGPLARLSRKLRPVGGRLANLVRQLRNLQAPKGPSRTPWETMPLLVADTLENAARRCQERRWTDCVMRCYRAVEVAVHGALLQRGVNPRQVSWKDLGAEVRQEALTAMNAQKPPSHLTLFQGLMLLQAMGHMLESELQKHLRNVQKNRNDCFLEHGYLKVGEVEARRCLEYAEAISAYLIEADLSSLRAEVRHVFA